MQLCSITNFAYTRPLPKQQSDVLSRLQLDRRRLEAGHLKYAILSASGRYHVFTSDQGCIAIDSDVSVTLKDFTPIYFASFTQKYAGMHSLVFDSF